MAFFSLQEKSGLGYRQAKEALGAHAMSVNGAGELIPFRNLVYRVHPLPPSLASYLFDFGSNSVEQEEQLMMTMLQKRLAPLNDDRVRAALDKKKRVGRGHGGCNMVLWSRVLRLCAVMLAVALSCERGS